MLHCDYNSYVHAHTHDQDQPDAVKNLTLVPSDGDLSLSWERPVNVPMEVPILYTVVINNTDTLTSSLNVTNTTSFSLWSLEEQVLNNTATGVCVIFEFSVSGSNDAGMGRPNTTIDTIPICKPAGYFCA